MSGFDTLAKGNADSLGNFAFNFKMKDAFPLTFSAMNHPVLIFLQGGDSIYISADASNMLSTMTFSGPAAVKNGTLHQRYSKMATLDNQMQAAARSKPYKEFFSWIDSLEKAEYLQWQTETANSDQSLKDYTYSDFKYRFAIPRLSYVNSHPEAREDAAVKKYISELKANDAKAQNVETYYAFLVNKYLVDAVMLPIKDSVRRAYPIMYRLAKKELKGFPRDFVLSYAVMMALNLEPVDTTKALLEDFKKVSQNNKYKGFLQERFNQVTRLMPGSPAPGWTYTDLNGKKVSLSDFKGKYVYVDVWASWCGPCRRENPYLKKIEHEFEGKNVVFISLSIDEKEDAWRKAVASDNVGGIQVWSPQGWRSSIVRDYEINGIPRYILIDPKGKLISSNAERPSGGIRQQLQQLLK